MRFINEIFTAQFGVSLTNERLLAVYEEAVGRLGLDDGAQRSLREFIRFQLGGERTRRTVIRDWSVLGCFRGQAALFESGAEEALDQLAPQIAAAVGPAGVTFDAVLTTTATGNLMPGLSYRIARRLGALVRPDSLMLDLANVGCTGSIKALRTAWSLEPGFQNILLVAVEVPTTLLDMKSARFDVWQGNCTFGDGAAALWITRDAERGSMALTLEEMSSRHFADKAMNLIRWGYHDYYAFALDDYETFDNQVREFVTEALADRQANWKDEPPSPNPLPPAAGGGGRVW